MFKVKKGEIFTFKILPEWVKYEAIYFIVKDVKEINEVEKIETIIHSSIIIEFNNHLVKGEDTDMVLTLDDLKIFKPEIVNDTVVLAKLLLAE